MAAALALGAEGVFVGTRLLASREAYAHEEYKRRIVAASAKKRAISEADLKGGSGKDISVFCGVFSFFALIHFIADRTTLVCVTKVSFAPTPVDLSPTIPTQFLHPPFWLLVDSVTYNPIFSVRLLHKNQHRLYFKSKHSYRYQ